MPGISFGFAFSVANQQVFFHLVAPVFFVDIWTYNVHAKFHWTITKIASDRAISISIPGVTNAVCHLIFNCCAPLIAQSFSRKTQHSGKFVKVAQTSITDLQIKGHDSGTKISTVHVCWKLSILAMGLAQKNQGSLHGRASKNSVQT